MIPPPQANGYQTQGASPFEDWVTHVNTAKRKIRSELSLEDWQKYGFGHRRAAEFDALSNVLENGLVPREKRDQLSVEEFWEKYEKPGKPCLIYGVPEKEGWACERWKWEDFFTRFGQSHFKVGKDDHGQTVRLRADYFEQYSRTQQDDSPVYLFDNHFKHEKKAILEDYHVPSYFPDDYMSLCDDRPPYRWVGVGPRRSGTIMHQDPLCTSAWNTLLLGRKLWLLLPPNTPKRVAKGKDVMQPEDDDEACNHFLDLLPRKRARQDPDFQPILCVQHPGETIFVPGNWWHCVVNLDDTIAVTQNYVGRHNFPHVWRSCRTERPCWSHRWLRAMEAKLPELANWAKCLNQEDGFDMNEFRQKNRLRLLQHRRRRALNALKRAKQRSAAKGIVLDEQAFLVQWQESQGEINSDSTASTTSSDSDSSETSASS